jgi:hypothetical protein
MHLPSLSLLRTKQPSFDPPSGSDRPSVLASDWLDALVVVVVVVVAAACYVLASSYIQARTIAS